MILITGATGHIGNVLVRKLVENGENVGVLIHNRTQEWILAEFPNIKRFYGDITDKHSLEEAFQSAKKVYHLAAIVSILPDNHQKVLDVNVNGTKNVVELSLKHKIEKLIYVSSIHAFEDLADMEAIIDESTPLLPEKAIGIYGYSKAKATLEVLTAHKDKGLNVVVVHPTGVIGPFDFRKSLMGKTIKMLTMGMPFVIGKYDFVDVRDVVNGIILADNKGRVGHNYILNGQNIGLTEVKRIIDRTLGRKEIAFSLPKWLVKCFVPFAMMGYSLTKKTPLLTSDSLQVLFSNSNISGKKARVELGYSPRATEDSIRDLLK